jgi:TolA-binding protein
MQPSEDYYQILDIDPSASFEQIKQAFRRLARRYHPDIAGESSVDRFRHITEAYQVLIDPQRRQEFDRKRHSLSSSAANTPPAAAASRPQVVVRSTPIQPSPDQQAEIQQGVRSIKQLLKTKQLMNAVHQAQDLVKQFPHSVAAKHALALAYHWVGNAFVYRGDKEAAQFYLLKSLEIEPDNPALVFEVRRDLARIGLQR